MASDSGPADPSAVSRLVAEAARACHVKEAVLLRDGGGVVRAAVAPVAQRLVDQRLLQAAGQTYCLQLYESTDRRLTSVELDNLQDITRRLANQLTGHPAIADDTWTEQSVTEALDHVTDVDLHVGGAHWRHECKLHGGGGSADATGHHDAAE